MDHDLLTDLRQLDDPDPPHFGALRAEEATRRAAQHQARRARIIAGSVLAVALVAGIGVLVRPDARTAPIVETATPPTTGPAVDTTLPSVATPPSPVPPAVEPPPATVATTVPPAAPGAGAGAGAAPSGTAAGPATTQAPAAAPLAPATTRPAGTGPPPAGTSPPPAGISLVLTLDAQQVASGGTMHGVVRFRNRRSTPVTLGATCSFWLTYLYRAGAIVPPYGITCLSEGQQVVAPGAEVVADVQVGTDEIAPGTYDVYTTVRLAEDGIGIHSQWQSLTVIRP